VYLLRRESYSAFCARCALNFFTISGYPCEPRERVGIAAFLFFQLEQTHSGDAGVEILLMRESLKRSESSVLIRSLPIYPLT
jgi:hypothetical protein